MELENQVVNLDLAKWLKELGVKQESIFYWKYAGYNGEYEWSIADAHPGLDYPGHGWCSAFTVAELGEVLVGDWDSRGQSIEFENDGITCMVRLIQRGEFAGEDCIEEFSANTEADARAKMLIYLIENKLVTI